MQVFVFENVLTDFTPGMAVIVANDLTRAQEIAMNEFPDWRTHHRDLEIWLANSENQGWRSPVASYPTSAQDEDFHYVYGGA